jgi:serine/threonine protein kinase
LCRGGGESETLLLADFGVSRPLDVAATFGGFVVGTPGHAPPEQAGFGVRRVGPFSDVFGFATVAFHMLTGAHYFPIEGAEAALFAIQQAKRRCLRDCDGLSPELRRASHSCRLIDEALTQATAPRPETRPQRARELADRLLAALDPLVA